MKALLAILSAALLAGCATMTVSRETETLVDIENSGWYLFNSIPLASGDPTRANECCCNLFLETVSLENNMRMLEHAMRAEGAAGVRDLTSYKTDESYFFVLLKRRAYHTSAYLTKSPPAK